MRQKNEQMYYYREMTLPSISSLLQATAYQTSTQLPLKAEYAALVSKGGLATGAVTMVSGSGSYTAVIEMLSVTSKAGFAIAFVGLRDLGVVALAQAGWDLSRVVLVDDGAETTQVIALLVAAFNVVVFDVAIVDRHWHRLVARARERRSALVVIDHDRAVDSSSYLRRSPPDVTLVVDELGWSTPTMEFPFGSPTLRLVAEEHGLRTGTSVTVAL
jgi:hypothetical protein